MPRDAANCLATLKFAGRAGPLVQVINEADGHIVYTLRGRGTTFHPKVSEPGSYALRLGESGTCRMRVLKNVIPLGADEKKTISVRF